jgi:hypothetical protein
MTAEDFDRRKKEGIERLEKEVKIYFIAFYFIYSILFTFTQEGMARLKKELKVFFP